MHEEDEIPPREYSHAYHQILALLTAEVNFAYYLSCNSCFQDAYLKDGVCKFVVSLPKTLASLQLNWFDSIQR